MPWTGKEFKERHNKGLSDEEAHRAARIANAMLKRGVPEGEAIATASSRASDHPPKGLRLKRKR